MYRLRDLLDWGCDAEIIPGVWVSARPLEGPAIYRWRAAWAVFRGRADAFTWPTTDDPTSWCSSPARTMTQQSVHREEADG